MVYNCIPSALPYIAVMSSTVIANGTYPPAASWVTKLEGGGGKKLQFSDR